MKAKKTGNSSRHRAQAALFEEPPKQKKPRDGSCDRSKLAKRIREVHAMPVDRWMRPLRNHMLRLAVNSAKHKYCMRAGRQEIAKAERISRTYPDSGSWRRRNDEETRRR